MLNKCRKNIKKDSIRNPKARNLFVGSHFDQNLQCYSTPIVFTTRIRRIFKEGGVTGNLRIMKTKRKISPLKISAFSCPKLGEDKNKGYWSDFVRFCAQTFCLNYNWGGMPQFCILFYVNYTILKTQRGWPWHHAPLNTPLFPTSRTSNIVCMR